METFMNVYAAKIIFAIAVFVAGIIGNEMRKLYKQHINTEEKERVAELSALYVEQVFTLLHGWEKMNKALETARIMLDTRGIAFDLNEMKVLIEAVVGSFNDAFYREDQPEDEPEAVSTAVDSDWCNETE